jgi:hypothetical protein
MVGDDEILGHLGGLCDVRLLGFVCFTFDINYFVFLLKRF